MLKPLDIDTPFELTSEALADFFWEIPLLIHKRRHFRFWPPSYSVTLLPARPDPQEP